MLNIMVASIRSHEITVFHVKSTAMNFPFKIKSKSEIFKIYRIRNNFMSLATAIEVSNTRDGVTKINSLKYPFQNTTDV